MDILFVGHFGGRNIGDEIILLSQMQMLENYYNERINFHVFTYDEDFTINLYRQYGYKVKTIEAFGLRKMFTSIKDQLNKINKFDIVILGGGGLIQDVYFSYGIFRYLLPCFIAINRGIPVASFSLGVYRFNYSINRALFKAFLGSSTAISVRDEVSLVNCREIGFKETIHLVPDSALLFDLTKIPIPDELIGFFKLTIVLREFFTPYLDILSNSIKEYLSDQKISNVYVEIVVFENNPEESKIALELRNLLKDRIEHIFISDQIDPLNYLSKLSQSDLVISGRLHGIVPSVILNKNIVCLSYSPKIEAFCREKCLKYINTSELKNKLDLKDYINILNEPKINRKNELEKAFKFLRYLDDKRRQNIKPKRANKILLFFSGLYLLTIHIFNKLTGFKRKEE